MVNQNPTEKVVDKDNHLRDCLKYLCLALPEPTLKMPEQIVREAIQAQNLDLTSALIRYNDMMAAMNQSSRPARIGR